MTDVPETAGFFFDFSNDPETGGFSDYSDRNYAQKTEKDQKRQTSMTDFLNITK